VGRHLLKRDLQIELFLTPGWKQIQLLKCDLFGILDDG
jgi:hypothetical protein